jgi:hypothetical protein
MKIPTILPTRNARLDRLANEMAYSDTAAAGHAGVLSVRSSLGQTDVALVTSLLQFFCIHCPYQPNATTMRLTAGVIVSPCKIPENYVKSISAQRQTDGRRAGLKIRSSQEGVGSSHTFGNLCKC